MNLFRQNDQKSVDFYLSQILKSKSVWFEERAIWKYDPKNSWQRGFPKQDSSLGGDWDSEGCGQYWVQHHSWDTETNRLVLRAFAGDFVAIFPPLIFQLNICRCHGSALAALSLLQLEPRRTYCLLQIATTKHSAFRAASMGCTSSGSNLTRRLERSKLFSPNPFNSSESFIETILLPSISIFHFFRFYSLSSDGEPVYFAEKPEVFIFCEFFNNISWLYCNTLWSSDWAAYSKGGCDWQWQACDNDYSFSQVIWIELKSVTKTILYPQQTTTNQQIACQ